MNMDYDYYDLEDELKKYHGAILDEDMKFALAFGGIGTGPAQFTKGVMREQILIRNCPNITNNDQELFDVSMGNLNIEVKSLCTLKDQKRTVKTKTLRSKVSIHKLLSQEAKLKSAQERPIDYYVIFLAGLCTREDIFHQTLCIYDKDKIQQNTDNKSEGRGHEINIDICSGCLMHQSYNAKDGEKKERSRWVIKKGSQGRPEWVTHRETKNFSKIVNEYQPILANKVKRWEEESNNTCYDEITSIDLDNKSDQQHSNLSQLTLFNAG
jgi:hypothetical protein